MSGRNRSGLHRHVQSGRTESCKMRIYPPAHHRGYAVPSFARQTGLSCTSCHTVYPELNTFGRHFKIMGYSMSKSSKPYEWPPPVAGVAKISYTHIAEDLPPDSVKHTWADITNSTQNDALYVPEIAGIYYAGRIYKGLGALLQGNCSGVEDDLYLEMAHIRYGGMTADKKLTYSITVNRDCPDQIPTCNQAAGPLLFGIAQKIYPDPIPIRFQVDCRKY
jgi:hypothetical protein